MLRARVFRSIRTQENTQLQPTRSPQTTDPVRIAPVNCLCLLCSRKEAPVQCPRLSILCAGAIACRIGPSSPDLLHLGRYHSPIASCVSDLGSWVAELACQAANPGAVCFWPLKAPHRPASVPAAVVLGCNHEGTLGSAAGASTHAAASPPLSEAMR